MSYDNTIEYQINGNRPPRNIFQYSTPYEHPRCRCKSSTASRKRRWSMFGFLAKRKMVQKEICYTSFVAKPFQQAYLVIKTFVPRTILILQQIEHGAYPLINSRLIHSSLQLGSSKYMAQRYSKTSQDCLRLQNNLAGYNKKK